MLINQRKDISFPYLVGTTRPLLRSATASVCKHDDCGFVPLSRKFIVFIPNYGKKNGALGSAVQQSMSYILVESGE